MRVGILTAGGDSPGLNAAIRGFGKSAMNTYAMQVIGFRDGFRGLAEDRRVQLGKGALSGILTVGGTILGTSRDKPHKMLVDGQVTDMTPAIVETYRKAHLDAIVCLGGGGTQKNALRLVRAGLNVVTLPKTIDNDVALTDATFGFATALEIATEAIDRLHSTAHSHHRIIVAEVMGHRATMIRWWLWAVLWSRSIASVAISSAVANPKVASVRATSLSMVLGSVTTFRPARTRRSAFFWVPPPPRQTSASRPAFRYVSTITGVMSVTRPSTSILCGLSRLVPRIVPPTVRMPDRAPLSRRTRRSSASPRNPSRKPTTSIPYVLMADLPKPRMAAFSPGLSPPAVRIPMRMVLGTLGGCLLYTSP